VPGALLPKDISDLLFQGWQVGLSDFPHCCEADGFDCPGFQTIPTQEILLRIP
jgi:hypothetical protein